MRDKQQARAAELADAGTAVREQIPPEAAIALLAWFDQHRRDLPWRRTRDPYAIWVSEIMLQQTRVAAVLEHYARWMERFPSVAALAAADEAAVLGMWSGLGYYRRARMLHRAAQAVVAEHGGVVPHTAETLRALPGIGAYTSAAIASIAFGESVPVVDGNVERVMTRVLGLALPEGPGETMPRSSMATVERAIRAGATRMIEGARPGDANQAMMELGATVCLPRAPLCLHCPVRPWCRTQGEHVAAARKPLVRRDVVYALCEHAGAVLLEQRGADASLMAEMWELPLMVAPVSAEDAVVMRVRHAITVTNYAVTVVRPAEALEETAAMRWWPVGELRGLALTGLARKVLRKVGVLVVG